ncbi:MAG TPA: GntR family transcriptional regulator [Euzebyales bacterium]|nr:GntR family transcriptional regulator [Euzebyales bacterium]
MDLAIDRRTAHQLVLDTLRKAILTGAIPSGTRLVQADIAEQLQVSTTPVREALRDLATEGLIKLDAHRGAEVTSLSGEEVAEIYRLRRILEPEVMRLAIERITEEEIAAAAEIQARADVEHDTAAWVELNHRFHDVFVRASGSPRLAGILQALHDAAGMYIAVTLVRDVDRRDEANREHHELLDAARRRDAQAATDAQLGHVRRTMEAVERAVTVGDPGRGLR